METNWNFSNFSGQNEYNNNLEMIVKSANKCLIVNDNGQINYANTLSQWIEKFKGLFERFGCINRTKSKYVRQYTIAFLQFGISKGWNISEKIKEIKASLPLFQDLPLDQISLSIGHIPELPEKYENEDFLEQTIKKISTQAQPLLNTEQMATTLHSEEEQEKPVAAEILTPLTETLKMPPSLIQTTSLKERTTRELTRKKPSGISVKKVILAAAALFAVGTSAFITSRSFWVRYYGCWSYYSNQSGHLEPVDQWLCQTPAAGKAFLESYAFRDATSLNPGKLNSELLNDSGLIIDLIIRMYRFDVLYFLGDDLKSDPEKLLAVLESAHYLNSKQNTDNNLFGDKLDLLELIPCENMELCLKLMEMYPKNHLLSFFNRLSLDFKQNKQILQKLFSLNSLPDVYDSLPPELRNDQGIIKARKKHEKA